MLFIGEEFMQINRKKEILKILEKQYSIKVAELCNLLYASRSTIRRDLEELEKENLIIRSHGKVICNQAFATVNVALSEREMNMLNVKKSLAATAISLIHDGNVIMLDASTTVSCLVHYLEKFQNIIAITCGVKTAYLLSKTNIRFLVSGGECINQSFSLIGGDTLRSIGKYNADICFVSCHGLSENGMVTDTSVSENEVRKKILEQSKTKVLLVDSTKINKQNWDNLCSISDFDFVICDTELPHNVASLVKCFILAKQDND